MCLAIPARLVVMIIPLIDNIRSRGILLLSLSTVFGVPRLPDLPSQTYYIFCRPLFLNPLQYVVLLYEPIMLSAGLLACKPLKSR